MLRLLSVALLASVFAAPALAQDKWQGADDLPTNPLPCDGGAGDGRRQAL